LEIERLKREKLEAQLDQCRQEIEKCVRQLRQYERKIEIMENYYDHINSKKDMDKKGLKSKKKSSSKNRYNDADDGYKAYERKNRPESRSASQLRMTNKKSEPVSLEHLNLSKIQQKELREAFNEIDTNSSGHISVNELKSAYDYLGIRIDESDLKTIVDLMDINEDGKISFIEFAEATAKKFYQKYTKREIVEAFKEFDKNGSGFVSVEELRSVLSKKGRLYTQEQIAKLIESVDKDKNGLISIDEFARLLN
jgi:calcium-binding protein CML